MITKELQRTWNMLEGTPVKIHASALHCKNETKFCTA